MHLPRCLLCLMAGSTLLIPAPAFGQEWRPTARLRSEVRLDDNPFLLDSEHRPRLAAPSSGDVASGRFRDMDNASDLIAIPSVDLGIEGRGLSGRRLTISADVAYEANLRNSARRHSEIELAAEQAIRPGGDLRFKADWRPSYFHKNYLADAVDLDADSNIAAAERVYARGTSREIDLGLRYRQRLVKPTDERALGVWMEVTAGYLDRRYEAPFAGRSRSGPDVGGGVAVQVGPVITLGVDYTVASLTSDPATAILILDETEFAVDFNGNLTTTDSSARASVLVDHSRVERQLDASLRANAGAATVTAECGRRTRRFGSDQPYDVVNRARRDVLNEVSLSAELRVGRGGGGGGGARLALGVRRGSQTTNRGADPGSAGDVADYTRHVWWAGVRYRF